MVLPFGVDILSFNFETCFLTKEHVVTIFSVLNLCIMAINQKVKNLFLMNRIFLKARSGLLELVTLPFVFLGSIAPLRLRRRWKHALWPEALSNDLLNSITLIRDTLRVKTIVDDKDNELRLIRLGSLNDGGYFVPSGHHWDGAVSAGIDHNDSFDLALAKLGTTVLQVDNSIDIAPSSHPNLHFERATVSGNLSSKDSRNLEALHRRLSVLTNKIDGSFLLKLDIEGDEWKLLANDAKLAVWDVIVVELHYLWKIADPKHAGTITMALEKLRETHECVFLHANNSGSLSIISRSSVPDIVEATFVSKSSYKVQRKEYSFSRALHPNNPNIPDIDLSGWN